MNTAQKLLVAIGGTAELVAGLDEHWWSDSQTAEKAHQRPLLGRGKYGVGLKARFDDANCTVNRFSSRMCSHGTKGCERLHVFSWGG